MYGMSGSKSAISYQKWDLGITADSHIRTLGDEKGAVAFLSEVDNKQEALCYSLNPLHAECFLQGIFPSS